MWGSTGRRSRSPTCSTMIYHPVPRRASSLLVPPPPAPDHFLAVLLTSIRIGSMGVVAAIRDLPEERGSRRPRSGSLQGSLLVLGAGLAAAGFPAENGYLMLLGLFWWRSGSAFSSTGSAARHCGRCRAGFWRTHTSPTLRGGGAGERGDPAMFFVEGVLMVLGRSCSRRSTSASSTASCAF